MLVFRKKKGAIDVKMEKYCSPSTSQTQNHSLMVLLGTNSIQKIFKRENWSQDIVNSSGHRSMYLTSSLVSPSDILADHCF